VEEVTMDLREMAGCRLKGNITSWGVEDRDEKTRFFYFNVAVTHTAPEGTYGDDSYEEVAAPFKVAATRKLVVGGSVKMNNWTLNDLAKLAGGKPDLDRFDVTHDEPYQLDGREVELFVRVSEGKDGREFVNVNFLWPRGAGKATGSKFADQLAEWEAEKASSGEELTGAAATPF
jgi:hypothetical protein